MSALVPSNASRPPRRRLATWLVILVSYLVVLVPVVVAEGPRERVRWYVAAAESNWVLGNQQAAQRLLEQALQFAPDERELWMRRAEWHYEMGNQRQTLADAAQALQGATGAERIELLIQRAQLLQQLERWLEAVDDWKEIRVLSESLKPDPQRSERIWPRPQLLNGLAYARALAHVELQEALVEASEALQQAEESADILDTRGYILFLMGRYEEAREDLDLAVRLRTQELQRWNRIFDEQRQQLVDISVLNRIDHDYRRSLAVILYHRYLVNERDAPEQAVRDLQRIRNEMGFEPGPELF
jgi:tetratricopeptide (TPR) repeat protein